MYTTHPDFDGGLARELHNHRHNQSTNMNGTMMQFFHWYYPDDGSLWDHAKDKAKELAELGLTALWLPPATKGKDGARSSGYDAYDLFDLGEFHQKGSVRTRYG